MANANGSFLLLFVTKKEGLKKDFIFVSFLKVPAYSKL